MNLESQLETRIVAECDKLIQRYHAYHNHLHLGWERNKKRVKSPPPKVVKTPEEWSSNPRFNPFYVRRNARAIAKSIAKKINARTYSPNPAYIKNVPKPDGGVRKVAMYEIPDAAVSTHFYAHLLSKNKHRFSSFSYAYRNDRNVHFAIQDIAIDLTKNARTFIAEFDFSDFFGSIDHSYLYDQFKENGFFISDEEVAIVQAFLGGGGKGIPQGTSISLFLANLVCWRLDKSLEKAGLKFARYADDTIIWSSNYSSICESFNIINEFSRDSKVLVNLKKSDGINLLIKEGFPAEVSSKSAFNFLGYSLGVERVSVTEKTIRRVKKQVSYLLYRNLIQPIKSKPLRGLIIPSDNRDEALVVALMQIRRYLYGGLLHREITDYLRGRQPSLRFKGVMSFYPLLNDEVQLRIMDGWLISAIDRAVQKRASLLLLHGYDRRREFPFSVDREDILEQYRKRRIAGKRLLEIPSFRLIFKAIQLGLVREGIERVMHPGSSKYAYRSK